MAEFYQILCFGKTGFDCSLSWIIMILIFFGAAILRKQVNDLLNMEFSVIGATILGELAYIITQFFIPLKFSLLIGLVALVVGGFILGPLFGDGGGGEE